MGVRDFLKRLFGKKVEALPPADIKQFEFYATDGNLVKICDIQRTNAEISNNKGNTVIYTAGLIKGTNNGEFANKKICFELPKDLNVADVQYQIQNLISTVYNGKITQRNYELDEYSHIGVINRDGYGGFVLNNPQPVAKQWIENNLNAPLRKQKDQESLNKQMEEQLARDQYYKSIDELNRIDEEKKYNEKVNRWNNPIFQRNRYRKDEYTLYQQPENWNDSNQSSGFSNLKEVRCIGTLPHRTGNIGYVYTANLNNYEELGEADELCPVYPKVCFEIPYSIEELETRFQNGDKRVVQYLGVLLNWKNLNEKQIGKQSGERIWLGAVKEDRGVCGIDKSNHPAIEQYIKQENTNIARMNGYDINSQQYGNNYQSPQDYGGR